ncbi:hypothetical protein PHIN3_372 [Sinorhizobium phage phiN3]|uniref:Uncharacterized protein n=1 Tax=Sinorhizobium phage phiN3 TaxID=1647405 RepID=A0A0F6YPC5_9CAUD|nr:hypothetical protein AVT40_gp161 [Sinorhizobium phage phiN3]AKF13635.1 hypothetical protein PHIN3_372 [Sinorhizobium phage phiN3]
METEVYFTHDNGCYTTRLSCVPRVGEGVELPNGCLYRVMKVTHIINGNYVRVNLSTHRPSI